MDFQSVLTHVTFDGLGYDGLEIDLKRVGHLDGFVNVVMWSDLVIYVNVVGCEFDYICIYMLCCAVNLIIIIFIFIFAKNSL
jgi:hypothetical protein